MTRDTGPAKLPSLPRVNAQDPAMRSWINAVTERLEVREGSRGNPAEKVVLQRELADLTSKVRILQTAPVARPGESLVPIGGGMYAAINVEAFADSIRSTRLYRDLMTKLDDPTRFESLHQQTQDVLLRSIAEEASKRGADIRRTEVTLQTANESLALTVSEITAALGTTGAGIRTVEEAYATLNTAQAAKVTQLEASLGNYYQDGTAGRAVLEDVMLAEADRVDGLSAQRTIKVSAGGAMAGIGLAATEPVAGVGDSAIIMVAKKLAFVTPDAVIGTGPGEIDPINPDTSLIPFGVGVSGVYINGQVRINASGPMLDSFSSGVDGKSTYAAPIYKRSATAPATPTGGTFDFAANVLTPPAGWSASPPAGTDPVYVATTTFSVIGQTATATATAWTTPAVYVQNGSNGTEGLSTFMYPVFQRAASAPATPTGGSYNFGTNTGTPPAGWVNTVPTGTNPVYTSSALASVTGATGTASALTWSAPVVLAKDGSKGDKGDTGVGTPGERGSLTGYGSTYALYYSSSWADSSTGVSTYRANRVIQNMLLGQSLTTDLTTTTHLRIGDTVTLGNAAAPTAVITKYWSGSAWVSPGVIIDGNLLVNGSVSAGKIDTTGLTIKDGSGNVIFSSGVNLASSRISGLGSLATQSSVTTWQVSGLGSLATMNSVPSTYIDSLVASKITSGTLTGITIGIGSGSQSGYAFYVSSGGVAYTDYISANSVDTTRLTSNSTANTAIIGSGASGRHGIEGKCNAVNAHGVVGFSSGYDFYAYGTAANMGPFTGSHDALVVNGFMGVIGDIVVDMGVASRFNVSNTICFVDLSAAVSQKGAVGVVATSATLLNSELPPSAMRLRVENFCQLDGTQETTHVPIPEFDALTLSHRLLAMNSVGEGQVNVCGEGGDLSIGDLIVTSSMPGKGMAQIKNGEKDDIIRSYTVAKCRENVTFSSPTEVKMVACIYLCG